MPLKVLKSSAGSGKTYALVTEYLRLVLSDSKQPGYYRHVLAITFTNAAALEMKERVMRQLSEFAAPKPLSEGGQSLCASLATSLEIGPDEVRARAAEVYAHMLHHYGQLSILTIDSFTHRIVRSFARDLRLSPDFQVEMDVDKLVSETIDRLLEQVGEDKEVSEYLLRFCTEKLEGEKNWDVRTELKEFSKQMFREEVEQLSAALEGKSLRDVSTLRAILQEEEAKVWEKMSGWFSEIVSLMGKNSLNRKLMAYGGEGVYTVWENAAKNQKFEMKARFEKFLSGSSLYSKTAEPWVKQAFDAIEPALRELSQQMVDYFAEVEPRLIIIKQILKKLVPMGLLQRMLQLAEDIKEEENIRLISDFHKSVANVVAQSNAPFIYERIGERYHHILFDEFQDTSSMQWRNFIPLIDNALARDGFNLIVGDGKQSIYRWRNGKAEQFVLLPEIPLNDIDASVRQQFRAAYREEVLPKNFRSARTIVEFNNALFASLAELNSAAHKVYADQAQQVHKDHIGFVEVVMAEKAKGAKEEEESADERWRVESKATFEAIELRVRECKAAGFSEGDIAILVRKRVEAMRIALYLQEHGWKVASEESFALENSREVRLTFELMRASLYKHSPETSALLMPLLAPFAGDEVAATAAIAQHVYKENGTLKVKWEEWVAQYLPQFHFPSIASLSPEAFADELIYMNGWQQNNFTERMLAELHNLVNGKSAGYAEVLRWWDEHRERVFVRSETDASAVKLVTVHKSKGLQYPVVIVPVFESRTKKSEIWLELDASEYGLSGTLAEVTSSEKPNEPEAFKEERGKMWLDDLNVLYVACTRPEERLYLIVETLASKSEKDSGKSLYNDLLSWAESKFGTGVSNYALGEKASPLSKRGAVEASMSSEIAERSPQEHRLRVIRPMKEDDPRIVGAQIHAMLANVKDWNDFQTVIESMDELSEEWKSRLKKMCTDSQLRDQFFTGDALVEQEMFDPQLGWLRPDRVVLDREELRVIDFKTGAPSESHTAQVKQYCTLLSQIRGIPAKGFVYYIREGKLELVDS